MYCFQLPVKRGGKGIQLPDNSWAVEVLTGGLLMGNVKQGENIDMYWERSSRCDIYRVKDGVVTHALPRHCLFSTNPVAFIEAPWTTSNHNVHDIDGNLLKVATNSNPPKQRNLSEDLRFAIMSAQFAADLRKKIHNGHLAGVELLVSIGVVNQLPRERSPGVVVIDRLANRVATFNPELTDEYAAHLSMSPDGLTCYYCTKHGAGAVFDNPLG